MFLVNGKLFLVDGKLFLIYLIYLADFQNMLEAFLQQLKLEHTNYDHHINITY